MRRGFPRQPSYRALAAGMAFAALAIGLGVLPLPSLAYDDPGHFYTTSTVLHHLRVPALEEPERDLIAYCAWLPDETHELSATGVFADAGGQSAPWFALYPACAVSRWFGGCPTILPKSTGGPLVIVQQLLHGLTGGNSDAVTRVAGGLMMDFKQQVNEAKAANGLVDPNLLCALGFSIHLYGDSFAHRILGSEATMYETGWGHTRDGHVPDHPCIAPNREQAWEYYARATGWVFDGQWPSSVDDQMNGTLAKVAESCVKGTDSDGDNNDSTLRKLLIATPSSGSPRFPTPVNYVLGDACENYLKLSRAQNDLPPLAFSGPKVLSCLETWNLYKPVAERQFFAVPGAIGSGSKYPLDYYDSVPQWQPQ